ncbi:glutamate--cysteine ligase regulatory subunit-like isoform X2 [Montipora capricornis]|uniref:glutamate--cysteine ligase regulatory subunit-like isoform X2 n=1 Tax=Montipora foliosa TaxID=591990 RepID=UPI0035F17178
MANESVTNGLISSEGITERSGQEQALKFAKTLYIHGGNISNWNRTRRKSTPSPSDEKRALRCINKSFVERIERGEREHLKISVKIFAIELQPALVKDALFRVMCELGVESVETLFLALPEMSGQESLQVLKEFWEEMECLFDSGYVSDLGVCDLDKSMLEKLYQWARIKPGINQVNLASCCVMPKDLVAFSEKHDIQLLTHADPRDILTKESLEQALTESCDSSQVQGWRPVWALRYSVLVKCRGVIKYKGYIVSCEQD